MDYQLQTITIRTTTCGPQDIPALVAVGTGLATHHQFVSYSTSPAITNHYVLTHVKSGYSLVEYMVEDQEQARRWLELVSMLADWNKSLSELKRYKSLPRKIKEAHRQVLRESMITV